MKIDNLTQKYGFVNPEVTPDPKEGYKVVVFEKRGKGTKFITILNPGDKSLTKKIRIFSTPLQYRCLAVKIGTDLRFTFDAKMTLVEQYQYFILNFAVRCYISDPKLVAIDFENDPIMQIQKDIETKLQKNVLETNVQLSEIYEYSSSVKEKILPNATLNHVRDFSEGKGIIIKSIDLTLKIPDEYKGQRKNHMKKKEALILNHELKVISDGHKLSDTNIEGELLAKRTLNQQQVKNVESTFQFQRDMLEMVGKKIKETDLSVISSGEMKKNISGYIEGVKQVTREIGGATGSFSENPLAETIDEKKSLVEGSHLDTESSVIFSEIRQFLLDMQAQVKNSHTPQEDKNAMISYIDHLLTEIKLGENSDPEIIEKYSGKVHEKIGIFTRFLSFDVLKREGTFKDKLIELISGQEIISE